MGRMGKTVAYEQAVPSSSARRREQKKLDKQQRYEEKMARKMVKEKLGRIDIPLLALTMIILIFGLVMLFSASYPYSYLWYGNSYLFIRPQVQYAAIGLVVMIGAAMIDYHWLKKFAWPLMMVTAFMLVLVLFMAEKNGAKRWIWFNSNATRGFQPSEIVKFAVILLFAAIIAANQSRIKTFKYGFLPFVLILFPLAGLLVLEPHLSCTILVLGIGVSMMFTGGTSMKWFGFAAIALGIALLFTLTTFPQLVSYAPTRIKIWLDPFDPSVDGHQTQQSLIAVGSGGIPGRGIGNSVQKYMYLPEMYNDYIFAVLCEELGFIGALALILLYILLLARGLYIGVKAKDKFGAMLVIGISVQIALQAMLHMAVNTNLIPSTGISLPFFSSGGSSLVMIMGQVGIMLSVSRQANIGAQAKRNRELEEQNEAREQAASENIEIAPNTGTKASYAGW